MMKLLTCSVLLPGQSTITEVSEKNDEDHDIKYFNSANNYI